MTSLTPRLEGYVKSPDGFGSGTYETLRPKGASLELVRSLFEGDVLKITSVRNTPDPALEKARGIRLYDGSNKLFDGYLRAPDYRRGSNKYRTLTTKIYDWRKELEAISITDVMDYTDKTMSYIIQDLCRKANSDGVIKKQSYKFDLSKLPYQSDIFEYDLISPTFTGTIWNALMELTRYMDILELHRTGQWTIKIDSLQSDINIYIIPQMVSIDTVAFGNYEVGVGFQDLYTHPYGLKLWAKTLTNIGYGADNLKLTVSYKDQNGSASTASPVTIPRDTPKGTYFPITLEQGDTLVKDVTNVTKSGGMTGDAVVIEGRVTRTLPDFKLQPPKDIWKDYTRLLNFADVIGSDGFRSQTLGDEALLGKTNLTASTGGSATILIDDDATFVTWGIAAGDLVKNEEHSEFCAIVSVNSEIQLTTASLSTGDWDNDSYEIEKAITSPNFDINTTLQPAGRNYLKVTITNPLAGDKTGSVKFRGFSGPPEGPEELLEERFFLSVPAGEAIHHTTDNRYYSLSMNVSPNTGMNITGFWNCKVKVEEFMYGVAGRSINLFGLRAGKFMNMDFDTQIKCDAYANEIVESFHAPTIHISANLKPGYVDITDLAGKTVRLEDELAGTQMDFLCTKQVLRFSGKERYEQIEAMRFNMDWEYTE